MLKSKLTYKDFEKHCRDIKKATSTVRLNDNPKEKLARIERAKKDYKFFWETYFPMYAKAPTAKFHIKVANAVKADKLFKGIFEAHRGSAKSTHGDIGIPLWLKICGESKCVMLVGQTEAKAKRLLASLQAQLMNNQLFIADFGEQFNHGNWADGEFVTRDGCAYFAIGLGQSPNGTRYEDARPDLIILDDCDSKKLSKNPKLVREAVEWVLEDLMGCFDIGNERFLLLNNRISKNSILANLHKQMVLEKPKADRWFHIQVNALDKHGNPTWSEKYTKEYWAKKRANTTLRAWELNYMNNPIEEGTVFKEAWIKWGKIYALRKYDALVVYVDPSFKDTATSDFKAVKFWGRKGTRELHLIDAFVRQCSVSAMVSYMYDLFERIPEDVIVDWYIEANMLQDLLLEEFGIEGDTRGYQLPIVGDKRKKPDKYMRIEATSPYYERGFVMYNEDKINDPDFATAKEQLLAFEAGSNTPDDSPDADEGALHILINGFRTYNTEPVIGERELETSW